MQKIIHERVFQTIGGKKTPVGAFIAVRIYDIIRTGWSRCNVSAGDTFNYNEGLLHALTNLCLNKPIPDFRNATNASDFRESYDIFRARCVKFFQGADMAAPGMAKVNDPISISWLLDTIGYVPHNPDMVEVPEPMVDHYFNYFRDIKGVTRDEVRNYIATALPLFQKIYADNKPFPMIPPMRQEEVEMAMPKAQPKPCPQGLEDVFLMTPKCARGCHPNISEKAQEILDNLPKHKTNKKRFYNVRDANGKFRRKSIMDLKPRKYNVRNVKDGRFCKIGKNRVGNFRKSMVN